MNVPAAAARSLLPGNGAESSARMLLAAIALVTAIGFGWRAAVTEIPIADALFGRLHWPEPAARALARTVVGICALAALQAMVVLGARGRWRGLRTWWCLLAAVPLADAVGDAIDHDLWLLALECASATAVPLALAFAVRERATVWPLRLACALTFAAHGIIAWTGWSRFVDLTMACVPLSEAGARSALKVAAIADLAAAVGVLGRTTRLPLMYMAAWGLSTAIARAWSGHYPVYETLVRIANGGLPLAVLLFLRPGVAPATQSVVPARLDAAAGFAALSVVALAAALWGRFVSAPPHPQNEHGVATRAYRLHDVTEAPVVGGLAVAVAVSTDAANAKDLAAIRAEIGDEQRVRRPFRTLTIVFDRTCERWIAEPGADGALAWRRDEPPVEGATPATRDATGPTPP